MCAGGYHAAQLQHGLHAAYHILRLHCSDNDHCSDAALKTAQVGHTALLQASSSLKMQPRVRPGGGRGEGGTQFTPTIA